MRDSQTEEFAELACKDNDGDACSKSHCDGERDVLDIGTEPEQPDRDKQQTCNYRGDGQSVVAVAVNHAGNQPDKCAGRSANLKAASADKRDDQTASDRGIEPAFG